MAAAKCPNIHQKHNTEPLTTPCSIQEQHAEAAQLAVLLQQSQRQKKKLRAISLAACALQRAVRCRRARKAVKQRRFNRDAEDLIVRRVKAADAIKGAWKVGKSRRLSTDLRAARTSARANRCAGSIQ
jgi:hypothetical protein